MNIPRKVPLLPCSSSGPAARFQGQLLNIFRPGSYQWQHSRLCSAGSGTLTLENTFKCYDLETGPPMDVEITRKCALKMLSQMIVGRRVEQIAMTLYQQQKIRGFCHLYNGQEAVAVGMHSMLSKSDSVITAYRCHVWTYLMGVSVESLMAELVGIRSGCSRGKGGSMHMYGDNYYGGNGIVGAQVPVGTGVALAHRYRCDGGVCITCYGDGAANQGQVFEAFNMAKLWNLPCIFVCENNQYGMGTHAERAAASTDYYMRGHYIPGLWVDGSQVLAVRSATQFALDYVKRNGPIVLEMHTYRFLGHSMSDPGTSYRTAEEVKSMRESRDPIINFRQQILDLCLASEEELKKLEADIKKQVQDDVKKALADREPKIIELTTDIYAKNLELKIRGVSKHSLEHHRVGDVCLGKPKRTPPGEIKDVPVGDAALLAAQEALKKKAAEKQSTKSKADKKSGAKTAAPVAGAPAPGAPAPGAPAPGVPAAAPGLAEPAPANDKPKKKGKKSKKTEEKPPAAEAPKPEDDKPPQQETKD